MARHLEGLPEQPVPLAEAYPESCAIPRRSAGQGRQYRELVDQHSLAETSGDTALRPGPGQAPMRLLPKRLVHDPLG